jgi:hypothetical protein
MDFLSVNRNFFPQILLQPNIGFECDGQGHQRPQAITAHQVDDLEFLQFLEFSPFLVG